MMKAARRVAIGLVFLSACAQSDDAATPPSADVNADRVGQGNSDHVLHRMPTGSTSVVSLKSLPNATCYVRSGEGPTTDEGLRVLTDDDGTARIQLDHLDTTRKNGHLSLSCTDDSGRTKAHDIEVQIDDTVEAQKPAPFNKDGKPKLAKLDVPADSLSDADVRARHLPPKPDKTKDPAGFQTWTELANSEATLVTPHVVNDGKHFHTNYDTSGNWSGYVVTSDGSQQKYVYVYGEWNVPRVYAEGGFWATDHLSIWDGIDGWGSNDVVQDGTDSSTYTTIWIQTSWYSAWTEWYPISEDSIGGFPVNPGDHIRAWTWLLDSNGNYSNKPTVGWFYIWNTTQNVAFERSTNIPAGTVFDGHAAEWILERPTVGGSVANLANYSWAQMNGGYVYDIWGGFHLPVGDGSNVSHNVTMTGNNGAKLSTCWLNSYSNIITFNFQGHN
jgi:hypothetical protein